jgi:hypothetical protein
MGATRTALQINSVLFVLRPMSRIGGAFLCCVYKAWLCIGDSRPSRFRANSGTCVHP